jgi:hypothetical protein
MYWVYFLPNWLFCLLAILVFVAFGTGGILLTRRWVRPIHVQRSYNDIVGFYVAGLTVLYGVALGLLAIGAWSNYTEAEAKVAREAADLSSLYHSVARLPEPTRGLLQSDLREYTRQVIDVGWPDQRRGIVPVKSTAVLDRFQLDFGQFEPSTENEKALGAEIDQDFDALEQSQSIRIDSATEKLAPALWGMVLIGAMICIAVTWFFHMESLSMHIWMTAFLAALLGLMVFMVAALDNPYRGNVSVRPDPFERLYGQMTKPAISRID